MYMYICIYYIVYIYNIINKGMITLIHFTSIYIVVYIYSIYTTNSSL